MCNVTRLMIGLSALMAVTAAPPASAKHTATSAYAAVHANVIRSVRVAKARHWKRGYKASAVSLRPMRPRGQDFGYYRSRRLVRTDDEIDLLLQCLLYQPFVICP
jgi:hypothetical protein